MTRSEFEALATKIEKHMQYIIRKKEQNASRSNDDYIRGMNRFNRLLKLHNAVLRLTTELASSVCDIHDDSVDAVDTASTTVSTFLECPCCYDLTFKAIVDSNKRVCIDCGHVAYFDTVFLRFCRDKDLRDLSIDDCII